jgi:hypothetical protein
LGRLGYRFTSDSNFRDTVIGMAKIYGAEVANDPSKPVRDVQQAASNALDKWEQGLAQARKNGSEKEFLGSTAGAVGVEIVATLVPVSKLGKLGKAAKTLDRITPDSLDEIGEVLTDAARAMEQGGVASEGAEQLLRGVIRGARDQGELLSVVKAARSTGNVEGLLRSGELNPKELAEALKFDKTLFDGKIDFEEALGYSTKGVDLTQLSTKQLGDIGEAIQTNELVRLGYTDIVAIKNKSAHGIDLVGKNPHSNEIEFFEIKTSAKGIAPAQVGDPEQFVSTRLQRAMGAQGHWDPKNTIPGLKDVASSLRDEITDPVTGNIDSINAKWVQLNLSRSPGSIKLEVHRTIEDWVKPPDKRTELIPDQAPNLQIIQASLGADERWDSRQKRNISATLYEAYAGDPLMKRVDEAGLVTGRDGTVNAYALYKPFGNQSPTFHVAVDANKAAEIPEQQGLDRAAQVTQQLALQTQQETLQRESDAPSRGGLKLT